MTLEKRIEQKKDAVECELRRILSGNDSLLFQAMRYSVLSSGKRFRPLLLLAAGDYFHAARDQTLPFACALELIHNYSLIHDDLPSMDNDDYRRGQPSCHKAFGEDIALLAGDGLLTLAFELMAAAPSGNNLYACKEEAIREICRNAGVLGMIEGQLLDITQDPDHISEDRFKELILKKTGGLIIAAVVAGGILGEASPLELEALHAYGVNTGLAFQIRDDIQDSIQDRPEHRAPRPNSVNLYGFDKAEKKLGDSIQKALKALDSGSIDSDELRYLALRLSAVKGKNKNEQTS